MSALLVVVADRALAAGDRYALKTESGIAFSDFRGYEGWEVVSLARTDQVLKVILGNPTMIDAYKAGVRSNTCHLAVKAKDYIFDPYQMR